MERRVSCLRKTCETQRKAHRITILENSPINMDPGLNQLLQWSIENSDASKSEANSIPPTGLRPLDAAALQALMGGPSDADLMRESMAAIQSADVSLDDKLVAFDNLEQLIENLDNANNMESLGLWTPLVGLLGDEQGELRRMAAWCVGTAVQNNTKSQERVSNRILLPR